MPRLTMETRDEFFDYVRRKVKELINFKEEQSLPMTARINGITDNEAAALANTDVYHWRYFDSIVNLAIERNLRIPVKISGKITNIADGELIRKMFVEASIRTGMLSGDIKKRLRARFSESVVYGFDHAIDQDSGETYRASHLSVFCFYAVTHGSPVDTIIFPSGKLSKGKE